jgi:hypothetical protein
MLLLPRLLLDSLEVKVLLTLELGKATAANPSLTPV